MIGGQNRLWAFGDSFTFGSELKDCTDEFEYSKNTWQALLAEEKDFEYKCVARGGISNDWIARNVLKYSDQIDSRDLIIIQWTYFSRFEFPIQGYKDVGALMKGKKHKVDPPTWVEFEDSHYFQSSPHIDIKGEDIDEHWAKVKNRNLINSGAIDINNQFYKKIYTEEYGAMNLLKNLKLVESVLQFKNYKFSFISNEILKFNERQGFCKNVIDNINPNHVIWFGAMDEYLGFDEWCTKEKFPRGQYNHPLEQAHQEAFKYVKEMRYV
jgi:hypothetical protein